MPPKKTVVTMEEAVGTSVPAASPPPLHRQASVWPRVDHDRATFKAADAAKAVKVNVEEITGYGFRAPLDVDGDPIRGKAVLTVVLTDGSKKAVEHPLT
jgi:hypothetical protein